MKNNLRELRKRGRWSQAEIGERVGVAHNTVSLYESGKLPLTDEIAMKFAKALGVGPLEIEIVTEDSVKEDAPPYRTGTLLLEILTVEELQLIKRGLLQRMAEASGALYHKMHAALGEIGAELERRPQVLLHEKKSETEVSSGKVSKLAASSKSALEDLGIVASSGKESPRSRGADEPSVQTHPPHRASHGVPKVPPPGHGGKGQK